MTDRSDLIREASGLRRKAEHEHDEALRQRLTRMAESYVHLAESRAWTEAHPADAAALIDLLMRCS